MSEVNHFEVKRLRCWANITVYKPIPLLGRTEERVCFSSVGLAVEGSREDVVAHLRAASEAYRDAAEKLENFPS